MQKRDAVEVLPGFNPLSEIPDDIISGASSMPSMDYVDADDGGLLTSTSSEASSSSTGPTFLTANRTSRGQLNRIKPSGSFSNAGQQGDGLLISSL